MSLTFLFKILFGLIGCLIFLNWYFAGHIYNFFIVDMTKDWYKEFFKHMLYNAEILDVGIGTAAALTKNVDMIKQKNLKIVGIDYDKSYIEYG